MPKAFIGRNTEPSKKQEKKPVPPPAPPPPPKPTPKPKQTPPSQKKGNRGLVIILASGLVFVGLMSAFGYFAVKSIENIEEENEEEKVTVITEPEDEDEDGIPDDEDNCPEDANEDQEDMDDDGLGDVCDDTNDREPEEVPEPELTPGDDTDSDGLTDIEELLYGTDARNPDTDGDSFLDGNEVYHRYDPLGFSPSTLLDTGSVTVVNVVNSFGEGFYVYAPMSWSSENLENPDSPAGADLQLNADRYSSIFVTYSTAAPDDLFDADELLATETKEGYSGFVGNDEREAYIVLEDGVYIFTYEIEGSYTIEYLQTFLMLLNSFHLLP